VWFGKESRRGRGAGGGRKTGHDTSLPDQKAYGSANVLVSLMTAGVSLCLGGGGRKGLKQERGGGGGGNKPGWLAAQQALPG
jgi:hypothetical protein